MSISVGEKLVDMANNNEDIVAITAAMPSGTGLNLFESAYPKRYYDVGIAEQHATGFAAGLAKWYETLLCCVLIIFAKGI